MPMRVRLEACQKFTPRHRRIVGGTLMGAWAIGVLIEPGHYLLGLSSSSAVGRQLCMNCPISMAHAAGDWSSSMSICAAPSVQAASRRRRARAAYSGFSSQMTERRPSCMVTGAVVSTPLSESSTTAARRSINVNVEYLSPTWPSTSRLSSPYDCKLVSEAIDGDQKCAGAGLSSSTQLRSSLIMSSTYL